MKFYIKYKIYYIYILYIFTISDSAHLNNIYIYNKHKI